MKQELTFTDTLPQNYLQAKEGLYNRYGGMLLGYIFNIVKDKALAEQHLIDLFANLRPTDMMALTHQGVNTFCRLQLLARKQLSAFFEKNTRESQPVVNMFTTQMTSDQQKVFSGIYYGGKSTAALAAELDRSEDAVRKLLKESFSIIRRKTL